MPERQTNGMSADNNSIYYVNTKTGQHARDLPPSESDGDTSDSDFTGPYQLAIELSVRHQCRSWPIQWSAAGLPSRDAGTTPGFGLLRRTGTPEPWIKKLADDGMSYYYYNKSDGSVQWTRPEPLQPTHTRDRSASTAATRPAVSASTATIRPLPPTSRTPPKVSRLSVYSDDSDIQPLDTDRARQKQNGFRRRTRSPVDVKMELTSAERIAQSLQQAIAPPPADLVTDLSAVARSAIQAIPPNVLPRSMRNLKTPSPSSPLKPAQRKVTANTVAVGVVCSHAGPIQVDAEELERPFCPLCWRSAGSAFVTEPAGRQTLKRLYGVFMDRQYRAGPCWRRRAGGSWKGFGWVSLGEEDAPREVLGPIELVWVHTRTLITGMSSYLKFASNVHVARHVDIDGIRQDAGATVEKARALIRTLEHALQSLYDESVSLLLTAQALRHVDPGQSLQAQNISLDHLYTATFDSLLSIGHEQGDIAQGDYNGSIDWRMSRLSVIDTQLGGALRPMSTFDEQGDMIDLEVALGRKGHVPAESYDSRRYQSTENGTYNDEIEPSVDETMVAPDSPGMDTSPMMDEEFLSSKAKPRSGNSKLARILGDEYKSTVPKAPEPELPPRPWYLQPTYSPTEIAIDPDGSVRAGTVPALVERLTAHEQGDPTFIKSFLMTFKSFATVDDLFDLLPPPKLTQTEREEWGKLKQHVIQIRVLNTFKSMVVDDDVLEKDDLFILDRMKEFLTTNALANFPAAKQLLILIERAQEGGGGVIGMVAAPQGVPPPPLLKLLDIDPLELARQLTIMESQLYQRIRPMECLQRAREQRTENIDNITVVIQTSNKIALWVAESVLSKEDSRRRAGAVKHLISVADRCRILNNFSTMAAITAGLNTPPIRRLKRTYMALFSACEMTIDSNKNFTKYRSMMTSVIPPCVPFIGVFLSTLQFIQDGNPDNLPAPGAKEGSPSTLVNFRKRQKASEVIQDIKRWQAPFNFHAIPSIQAYIEESLNSVTDTKESSERFWMLSLEREPREREDEKMARLLQESGFL
ncbi:ras guanine nucleotide exchange factor domain-containing protein [Mycena olivaceomarginata]|nr:ras guanine nucleotide exchange factor domain-containing protein [Mycena olivaceomarginata]